MKVDSKEEKQNKEFHVTWIPDEQLIFVSKRIVPIPNMIPDTRLEVCLAAEQPAGVGEDII